MSIKSFFRMGSQYSRRYETKATPKMIAIKVVKWLVALLLFLVVLVVAFLLFAPTFGGKPDSDSLNKIKNSPNFNGETFVNLEPTSSQLKDVEPIEGEADMSIWAMLSPPEGKLPSEPLPTVQMDKDALKDGDFVWLGHSSALFVTAGKTIMVDPVYHNASPISHTVMPFEMTHSPTIDELPELDAVLISHDHYDHLDDKAIKLLNAQVKHFYVPLGIKAHLQRWGVADDKITELDWWEQVTLGETGNQVQMTLTPSRHFSGRNINNRNSTLWSSWVVKSADLSLFFSGDSGYGKHYAEIGKRFGPFDIALMEDGQYNRRWDEIHMMPEQGVQAVIDLDAKYVLPVHWGKFDLAPHPWKEPIQRFLVEADKQGITTLIPQIGQVFNLQNPPTTDNQEKWWESVQ